MLIKEALNSFLRIVEFYIQGFRAMKLGKTLWQVILIKLFVIFVVLKIFVFDGSLSSAFADESSKSEFVLKNLTDK